MSRFSSIRADHIEYSFWLVFSRNGDVRMSRGEPAIERGERAMSCTATLPLALFRTPELRAKIRVDEAASMDFSIDVEAAAAALKQAVGVDVDLRIASVEGNGNG